MADRAEFENIVAPYMDVVYRTAFALSGKASDAEDLTQDTFAKALGRFDSFGVGTNPKAWLLTILRNTWIDELRHRKVVGPSVSIDEVALAGPESQDKASWASVEDVLESFSDEVVIDAMKDLPDDQRLTLFLVDVEQLSHEEVAKITDVATGTVKSRTSRARSTLRQKLLAHARDLGFLERKL